MALIRYILCLLLPLAAVYAQTGASLNVRVVSERGNGIPEARVVLWPQGMLYVTDQTGMAVFEDLMAGQFTLDITVDGFAPFDTLVEIGNLAHADLRLSLRKITTTLPEVLITGIPEHASTLSFSLQDIQSYSSQTLADFLKQAAGLDIRSDGTAGSEETVAIGGSNANQVLVLVDGQRLRNLGNGNADLSTIPLDWVESIDLERGGQVTEHGEAIGGILRITTRSAMAGNSVSMNGELHSTYSRTAFSRFGKISGLSSVVAYSHTEGPGDFRYTISPEDGNGLFTTGLGQSFRRFNAGIQRDQFFFKVSSDLGKTGELNGTGMVDYLDQGIPGYIKPYPTLLAKQDTRHSSFNLRATQTWGQIQLNGQLGYQKYTKDFTDPEPTSLIKSLQEASHQWDGELRAAYQRRRSTILSGIQVVRENMTGSQLETADAVRNHESGWVQWNQQWYSNSTGVFSAGTEAGLRSEKYSSARFIGLPRFGVAFHYSPSFISEMSLAWGKSYRAPSFYELFWQENQATIGNPDLKPEQSNDVSARLFVKTKAENPTSMEIAASDKRIDDYIVWRPTFDIHWKPTNLKAHLQSLSANFQQLMWTDRIRVSAGAEWTDARNASDEPAYGGRYLIYHPRYSYQAAVRIQERGVTFGGDYQYVSKRPAIDTNSKWLGAYRIVDLALGYTFRLRHLQIDPEARVQNLLNETYRLIRFAPMPEREYSASLRLTWIP